YLAALAGAPTLEADDRKQVSRIRERALAPDKGDAALRGDAVFVSRVALALQRTGDREAAEKLLTAATAIQAAEAPARMALGTVLMTAGRYEEPRRLFESVRLAGEDRFRLVELFSAMRDWPRAEQVCRNIYSANKEDLEAKRW